MHPEVRDDYKGLIWLVHSGEEIVEIEADRAKIRTTTGAVQSFYRRPSPPGQLCAWALESRRGAALLKVGIAASLTKQSD